MHLLQAPKNHKLMAEVVPVSQALLYQPKQLLVELRIQFRRVRQFSLVLLWQNGIL